MPQGSGPPPSPEISDRAIVVFVALQVLDVITTVLGLRMGAQEGNFIVARFMQAGPAYGLLIAKFFGFLMMIVVFAWGKVRLLRWLNLWFAGVVTWNLAVIWIRHLGASGG